MELNLQVLNDAVRNRAAAFRCVTEYQPAGGKSDKIFPPTYEGGKYATEKRINADTGEQHDCVLLDSVASQANRMETALLEARRTGRLSVPILEVRFDQDDLLRKFTVTSLDAPHRIADALFRDSLLDGKMFRKSEVGMMLDTARVDNAADLFGVCPTALLFGFWDSTGPRGGSGVKFQRGMTSEIVGYDAVPGKKTGSRIDPAEIRAGVRVYERATKSDDRPDWTLDDKEAVTTGAGAKKSPKQLGKDGKPSEANHGNVTPTIEDGGFTIRRAVQTTTISLNAIRRLRFPMNGGPDSDHETDVAARAALAALGLVAGTIIRGDGDLRSRCHLVAETPVVWELLEKPGQEARRFQVDEEEAIELLHAAVEQAKGRELKWGDVIRLTPSDDLVAMIKRSQALAPQATEQD